MILSERQVVSPIRRLRGTHRTDFPTKTSKIFPNISVLPESHSPTSLPFRLHVSPPITIGFFNHSTRGNIEPIVCAAAVAV